MARSSHYHICVTGVLAAFLALLTATGTSMAAETTEQETDLPFQTETVPANFQLPVKPPKLPPVPYVTNRLDNIHDSIFLHLQRPAQKFDDFLAKNNDTNRSTTISRFRLGLYAKLKDEEGFSARFEPEVEAEVRIPNLEKRWSIFIDSMRDNDLPGTDPTERPSVLNTGFRRVYDDWNMHADVGVRWRSGPAGLARLEWRPDFSIGKTKFYPRERIFYESWNGFGEMTSLTVSRTMGCFFSRLVSGAKWNESSNGLEWELTSILGYAGKLIEENRPRALINDEDVAQGLSLRYSMFGHNSSDQNQIDRHRVTLVYRHPILRDWIFLQIAPGIEWLNDSDWENIPSIQIGFDTLFWEVTKK